MTPYYADSSATVYDGDCLAVLPSLPDDSVDAVVTDPPYGLEFMGKEWDSFAPARTNYHGERADTSKNIGSDDSRPSSRHRVSYSMTRPTFRRCAGCGKREFSGSPCVCEAPEWLYEQPAGTPTRMAAFETWCEAWARECLRVLKPGGHLLAFGGTRTAHRLTSAIEDAGFEIRDTIAWLYGSGFPKSRNLDGDWSGWGTALKPAFEPILVARKPPIGTIAANVEAYGTGAIHIDACRVAGGPVKTFERAPGDRSREEWRTGTAVPGSQTETDIGRWPTNVALDPDVAAELDAQTGMLTSGANPTRRGSDKFRDAYGDFKGQEECTPARGADSGGASRFFPVFRYEAKAPTDERPRVGQVAHPTVKPLDLMRWLVRLVTPPGGIVLDPFLGSGTTAEACIVEGFRCIGIEREADYLPLILARITKPIEPVMFGMEAS